MLYHIDTDMGVDDALALVVAQQAMGGSLIGLSTVAGNVSVEAASRNALLLTTLLGRVDDLPIYQGAGEATDGYRANAEHVHGSDGLGNATFAFRGIVDDAAATVRPLGDICRLPEAAGLLTLIGLGPATNLPRLVELYGRRAIGGIVVMSGAFFDVGNITPEAEFNAHLDPHALRALLALDMPVTFVPLDICRKIQLPRTLVRSWLGETPSRLAQLIVDAHMTYMDFYCEWEAIDGCFPHDTIAVLAALHPGALFSLRGDVTVEVAGEARGRTSFSPMPEARSRVVTGGPLKWIRAKLQGFQCPAGADRTLPRHGG